MNQLESTWLSESNCDFNLFKKIVEHDTCKDTVPLAADIHKGIPVYSGETISQRIEDKTFVTSLLSEWNQVFDTGAGVVAIKGAFTNTAVVDQVTEALTGIIKEESQNNDAGADHFAAAGANSRVWNAHEKLARANPELFIQYYANPVIHLASRAWLGPNYQITAQVNVVHPGGNAQVCHRDYHLGFQTVDQLTQYPGNVHRLSPHLTLQGAIVHSAMPLESGPTQLLPHSQNFHAGYLAAQLPEYRDYFLENYVQLPLNTGDMTFFNPAVFHAAGENKTTNDRFANLLQIGSAFGRVIEIVDRKAICEQVYPALLNAKKSGSLTNTEIEHVIAAAGEGYSFPCNLDLTPPVGGLAPASQQDILREALANNHTAEQLCASLNKWQSHQHS